MSGTGQDNSSGNGKPVVRLRGLPAKAAAPPPSTPVIPPKSPNAPPEVRFKRRPSSQAPMEDPSPPPETPAHAEEPFVPDALSPESPVEQVEPHQEQAPFEQSDQAFQEPLQTITVEYAAETFEAPAVETPVEQCRPIEAPVEPGPAVNADAQAAANVQKAIPKAPDPPVAGDPNVARVRLRMPPKAASATTGAPAALDPVIQPGTRPAGPSAAPAVPLYTPDTDLQRVQKRQWWKYNL